MKKWFFLLLVCVVLIIGCKKLDVSLSQDDFEIKGANWDAEIEFDCKKCDKPVCEWRLAWELEYQFNPSDDKGAVCWYQIDNKVKVKQIFEKNKMFKGTNKISDPDLTLDCRGNYKVGLCCAHTVDELLKDKYICKDTMLKALCP